MRGLAHYTLSGTNLNGLIHDELSGEIKQDQFSMMASAKYSPKPVSSFFLAHS